MDEWRSKSFLKPPFKKKNKKRTIFLSEILHVFLLSQAGESNFFLFQLFQTRFETI
jgi:hypothetical protein